MVCFVCVAQLFHAVLGMAILYIPMFDSAGLDGRREPSFSVLAATRLWTTAYLRAHGVGRGAPAVCTRGICTRAFGPERKDCARTLGRQRDLFWITDGARPADVVWHQLLERPVAGFSRGAFVFSAGEIVCDGFTIPVFAVSALLRLHDVSRRHRRHRLLVAPAPEFRRSMEAATINPRDASAHYQLGLIYQYRRQYAEAISRFRKSD